MIIIVKQQHDEKQLNNLGLGDTNTQTNVAK